MSIWMSVIILGHEVHRHFPEWKAVCRGRGTEVDEDHSGNTLWRVRYEADGMEEDLDKQQMEQYVINRRSSGGGSICI